MPEKKNFERGAAKAGGETDKDSLLKDIEELNLTLGLAEDDMSSKESSEDLILTRNIERTTNELMKDREENLRKSREHAIQHTREIDQARGIDVRRVVAEAETAARETDFKIVKQPSPFDSDMQELTVEKPKRKEIDVIGFDDSPVDKEFAEKVERYVALQDQLEAVNKEIARLEAKKAEEEAEAKAKAEAEAKAKAEAEAKAKAAEKAAKPQNPDSLVAVGVDWTNSEDRLAKKLARKDLNAELKEANLIKRIWKGRLFREYYEEEYMDEYLEGERTNENGETLYEIIEKQKQELMEDIVFDVTDEVHEINSEELDKRLTPVDKETNEKIKSTIEDYARFMLDLKDIRPDVANDPEFMQEVDDRFDRYMIRILEKAEDEGKIDGYIESNNYLEVAKEAARRYEFAVRTAKSKVEQDAAMAKVMYGFQAYNYESRKSFSEEHKSNLDRILDQIGTKEIGHFVPAETLSNAIDMAAMEPEEAEIVDDIKSGEELIGGEEGIKIMLDKSPISAESVARWQKWWESLSDEGKDYVIAIVKHVRAYPKRYDLKWGNGFRTWLTLTTARNTLGVAAS